MASVLVFIVIFIFLLAMAVISTKWSVEITSCDQVRQNTKTVNKRM